MTRTGHVPRLQEAEPWPRVRLGAASLLALGLKEGIWCAFTTSWGSAAAGRAGRGAQGGEAFLPMHWTDSQCSQGRSIASLPPWWILPASPCSSRAGCGPSRSRPVGRGSGSVGETGTSRWTGGPGARCRRAAAPCWPPGQRRPKPCGSGWQPRALAATAAGVGLARRGAGRGSHRWPVAGGERRPDIKVELLASLLGTPLQAGP